MRVISDLDLLVNRDHHNQMHCRTMQLYTMVGRCAPAAELLMYRALEPTRDIHHHSYVKAADRWSYVSGYVNDGQDLALLGFAVDTTPKLSLDDAVGFLRTVIDGDQPVSFYAPRGHFDFWVERMRRDGTPPEMYLDLHSFMCCGITEDAEALLIVDNTSANVLHPYVVPFDTVTRGYASDPSRWFLVCQSVRRLDDTPDIAAIEARYVDWIGGYRDTFGLYEVIADSFVGERDSYPDPFRRPSLTSLALLAGSRDFFSRFLTRTAHVTEVVSAFAANADMLITLLNLTSRVQDGTGPVGADELRGMLIAMQARERSALRELQADLERLTADRGRGSLFHVSFPT